jgi:hypothetical protein
VVRLFHTSQFVVATGFDTAEVGTFTRLPERYAEGKTTAPVPEKGVAATSAWRSCRRRGADRGLAHAPKVPAGSPPARS